MFSPCLLWLTALVGAAVGYPAVPCTSEELFKDGRLTHANPRDVTVTADAFRLFALGDWGVDTLENVAPGQFRDDFDVSKRDMIAGAINRRAAFVNEPPHLLLNVGDSFYTDGVRSTDDPRWNTTLEHVFQKPENVYWYSVMGNHDYYGNEAGLDEAGTYAQIAYTSSNPYHKWCMPSYNYSMTTTVNPTAEKDEAMTIKFIFIDTQSMMLSTGSGCRSSDTDTEPDRSEIFCRGDDVPVFAEQMAWLEQEACGAKDTHDYTVVVAHHPLVSAGYRIRGYDPKITEKYVDSLNVGDTVKKALREKYLYNEAYINNTLNVDLTPLLTKCGVDVYFSGHEHMTQVFVHTDEASGHQIALLSYGDSGKANLGNLLVTEPHATACLLTGQCFASDEAVKAAYGKEWELLFKHYGGAFADVSFRKDGVHVQSVGADGSVIHDVVLFAQAGAKSDDNDDDDSNTNKTLVILLAVACAIAVVLAALAIVLVFRLKEIRNKSQNTSPV
ncbi:Purple acid phosphatase 17 [Diplonema papillatum]|nr:Purple acid phosphatase 17 [Diplonema papillatum]